MDSEDARFYLSVFVRRLHYFLIPAALVTAVGIAAALRLPPVYLAAARILIEFAPHFGGSGSPVVAIRRPSAASGA